MRIEEQTARIEGQPIRYVRTGMGPPLVLLHGLLGGSFCWRMNIEALSRQRTVFALDLPGMGACDASRNTDCGMAAQAVRISLLLEKLALQSVDVLGSSWGGAIAMFLAARSARVRSLVLAAPVNPWSNLGSGRIRFLNGALGSTLLRMAWPVSRPLHRIAVERMYGDRTRVAAGTIEGYSSVVMRPGRVHNILNTLQSWEKDVTALNAAIALITVPSLLIWGTREGAVDLKSIAPLQRALPGCELALMEGAGHLPFEEMPDEFNRLVLDFLERREQNPARA
jgi:pimeloyl-ACP methyl ester carboxylesterase